MTTRPAARLAVVCAGPLAALCLGSAAAAADPLPCRPEVTGYGPTITIDVDYRDPTKSTVDYDSSATSIMIDPCA